MRGRGDVIILSSNNYLGLCNTPEVVRGGAEALEQLGAGTASVRFICGTFTIHETLERALADLVDTEAALTFASCWNANEALVPTLLGQGSRQRAWRFCRRLNRSEYYRCLENAQYFCCDVDHDSCRVSFAHDVANESPGSNHAQSTGRLGRSDVLRGRPQTASKAPGTHDASTYIARRSSAAGLIVGRR